MKIHVSQRIAPPGYFTLASQHQQERNHQFQKEPTVSPRKC